jgi:hypothetical protein
MFARTNPFNFSRFLLFCLGILFSVSVNGAQNPEQAELPPKLEYNLVRTSNATEQDIELEFNELGRMGYRYSAGGGGTKNVTETALAMYRDLNHPFPAKYEYKILVTRRVGTMSRELNEAGKQGYCYCTEFVPFTQGYKGLGVVLEREVGNTTQKCEYKVIDDGNLLNVEREMNEAGRNGFRYGGMKGTSGLFGGGVKVVIMFRPIGLSASRQGFSNRNGGPEVTSIPERFEYRLAAASRPLALQGRMNELGGQGFRYEDVNGPYAKGRPNEIIVLLSRREGVTARKYEYLVLDHFNFRLRDELGSIGQQGYDYLGKLILHSEEIHGVALFGREAGTEVRGVNFLMMTALNVPQMTQRLNEAGARGYELMSISAVNRGYEDDDGICPVGRRREDGDVVVILRQRLNRIPLDR